MTFLTNATQLHYYFCMQESDTFEDIFRMNGLRVTQTRRALLQIFSKSRVPLSAASLLSMLTRLHIRVNKTTVYRELDRFVLFKIIDRVRLGDRTEYYELRSLRHHHHLICVQCENVEDVHINEGSLSREEERIIRERQFVVFKHALEFFGVCRQCQHMGCEV